MVNQDFRSYNILHFDANEIINTGANLSDVAASLIAALDRFRKLLHRPVLLLKNGLTTGDHKSRGHKAGLAADICLREADGEISINEIFKTALIAGFYVIGIYHNGAAYSFHLEIDNVYRFWMAYKKHREAQWHYASLLKNPKEFTK